MWVCCPYGKRSFVLFYTQSLLFQLALEAALNNGALLTFSMTVDWVDIYRVHLNSCYNEMIGEKTSAKAMQPFCHKHKGTASCLQQNKITQGL